MESAKVNVRGVLSPWCLPLRHRVAPRLLAAPQTFIALDELVIVRLLSVDLIPHGDYLIFVENQTYGDVFDD